MNERLIDRIASRYQRLSLWIIAAVSLLALAVISGSALWDTRMISSIVISALFSIIAMQAFAAVWRHLAKSAPASLAKFYLAAPVVRIVAALLVMLAVYAAHRGDTTSDGQPDVRGAMLSFTAVFFSFYILLMIFESIYFAQVEKRNKI